VGHRTAVGDFGLDDRQCLQAAYVAGDKQVGLVIVRVQVVTVWEVDVKNPDDQQEWWDKLMAEYRAARDYGPVMETVEMRRLG